MKSGSFWAPVGVGVLAMVIVATFWRALPAAYLVNESSDYSTFYEPVARRILAGEGLTQADGTAATRYPPGFPLLLAGLFGLAARLGLPEATVLNGFILACSGLASVCLFGLARTVWNGRWAWAAALAWMTYPFMLWLTKQPNSEIPFIPALYGSVGLFWWGMQRRRGQGWLIFLAGALIGAAMLIRPMALGLGALLALLLWALGDHLTQRRRLGLMALLLLGNLVVVGPWEAWAYARSGEIIPLSSGGALTVRDGVTFLVMPKEYRQGVPLAPDLEELLQAIYARRAEMVSLGGVIGVTLEEGRQRPLALGKLIALKAARSWYATDSNRLEQITLLVQAGYLALIAAGAWAAWRQGGGARRATLLVGALALYFWAMTMLVVPLLRYTLPAMGLLLLLAPGALRETAAAAQRLYSGGAASINSQNLNTLKRDPGVD